MPVRCKLWLSKTYRWNDKTGILLGWHFCNNTAKWLQIVTYSISKNYKAICFIRLKKEKKKRKRKVVLAGTSRENSLNHLQHMPNSRHSQSNFGNNNKIMVDLSWVSLWNVSRCPLMNDRWIEWYKSKEEQTKIHEHICAYAKESKKIFMILAKP